MQIVWDERKRLADLEKHGLDFGAVALSIFETDIVQDAKHGRLKAIGYVQGQWSRSSLDRAARKPSA